MQVSDNKSKNKAYSVAESVESGEVLSSSSEWKLDSDELFVTCINKNSAAKFSKTNKILLESFY